MSFSENISVHISQGRCTRVSLGCVHRVRHGLQTGWQCIVQTRTLLRGKGLLITVIGLTGCFPQDNPLWKCPPIFSKIFNEKYKDLEKINPCVLPSATSTHFVVFWYFCPIFSYNRSLFRFTCVFFHFTVHHSFLQHSRVFCYLPFIP